MKIGESRLTNMVLRMLDDSVKEEMEDYISEVCSREFKVMDTLELVNSYFKESLNSFLGNLTEDDLINLRSYTGYNFRNINAILRGTWTYDKNGVLKQEKIDEFRILAEMISELVNKYVNPGIDFVTFRGTSLDAFASYGITDLLQLEELKGKFLYEQGFISTSILQETSYFNKDLGDGIDYNIEIRYLVTSECNDGILLSDDKLSYSSNQNEYLINKSSLSKVIDVKIDKENNTAILTAVLVPKKMWGLTEQKENGKGK